MCKRGSRKGKTQIGSYLLVVGLDDYKWYQSQTLGNVQARKLSPEGGWTPGSVPTRTLGPEKVWTVRSHIDWRGEQNILCKGVETSSQHMRFKNFVRKPERKNSNRTISAMAIESLRPLLFSLFYFYIKLKGEKKKKKLKIKVMLF